MARKKQRSSLSPRPVCGIESALHQQHSDGSWYATPTENGNHRRSSAPTSIWILPKSSRSLQCDGKWRSHSRRRARTSESKLNASGPKKRSRAPHQYCSASTVWFVSGRTRLWKQIRCHMLQRGKKTDFTFSDAIAVIRYEIFLSHSPLCRECNKNPPRKFRRLLYALCFSN